MIKCQINLQPSLTNSCDLRQAGVPITYNREQMYSLPSPSFELSTAVTASTIQILRSWIDHAARLLTCIRMCLVRMSAVKPTIPIVSRFSSVVPSIQYVLQISPRLRNSPSFTSHYPLMPTARSLIDSNLK
jgi:hypothetical protein